LMARARALRLTALGRRAAEADVRRRARAAEYRRGRRKTAAALRELDRMVKGEDPRQPGALSEATARPPIAPTASRGVTRIFSMQPGLSAGVSAAKAARDLALPESAVRSLGEMGVPIETLPTDPWRHRGSSMRCSTCMWYQVKANEAKEFPVTEVGRCRRHAPAMNGYPVVFPADWCGDHKLDETKV